MNLEKILNDAVAKKASDIFIVAGHPLSFKLSGQDVYKRQGQYACVERLTIVGPKKEMPNVSILGPVLSLIHI